MLQIDFWELRDEIVGLLEKNRTLVLATSADNRVTARAMSCVNIGLTVLFQTDRTFLKFAQIVKNPNVALAFGNVQIEGKAVIREHPLAAGSTDFIELFRESHPGAYEKYSHLKNNILVQVEPLLVTLWKYIDGKPCRDFLYVAEGRAERVYYDISDSVLEL